MSDIMGEDEVTEEGEVNERTTPESGAERDEPRAQEYLERRRPTDRKVLIPVAGFVLLAVVTAAAFVAQRPKLRTQEARAKPEEAVEAPHQGGVTVSRSYDEQLAWLEAALEADPNDTLALASLSELMLDAHQPERSLELAARWLAIAPRSRDALYRQVQGYAALRQWSEATVANRRLLELDPEDPQTRLNMGSLEANLGNVAEARGWWEGVLESVPGTPAAEAAQRALDQLNASGRRP